MTAPQQGIVVAGRAMELRQLKPEDGPALVGLHQQVFGAGADSAWFDWKYGVSQGAGLGMGLWHEGQMIAFCGGVPRRFQLPDQAQRDAAYVQIGDVMVRPDWRAVLTRRSVFLPSPKRFTMAISAPKGLLRPVLASRAHATFGWQTSWGCCAARGRWWSCCGTRLRKGCRRPGRLQTACGAGVCSASTQSRRTLTARCVLAGPPCARACRTRCLASARQRMYAGALGHGRIPAVIFGL